MTPEGRVARAAGGLLWGELDGATQQHGLATTGGVISYTGIGGLTLGGGLGHLMRRHGLTVDNLLAVDLVTADGEPLRVDADSEPELLWGCAAAAATSASPPPRVPAAPCGADRARRAGVLAAGGRGQGPAGPARLRPGAPDEAGHHRGHDARPRRCRSFRPSSWQAGAGPGAGLVGRPGGRAAGDRAPAGATTCGRARPPRAVPGHPVDAGRRPRGAPLLLAPAPALRPPDEVIDALLDQVASVTSPFSQINGWVMGGAVSRVDPRATAVGEREVAFDLSFAAAWPPADPDGGRQSAWVRRGWRLAPNSAGVYVNFISDEGPAGVETAYGQRLKRPHRPQGPLGPDQPVPHERQHPTEPARC